MRVPPQRYSNIAMPQQFLNAPHTQQYFRRIMPEIMEMPMR